MSAYTPNRLGELFTKVTGETTVTDRQTPQAPPSVDGDDPDANPGAVSAYITAAAKADLASEAYDDPEGGG